MTAPPPSSRFRVDLRGVVDLLSTAIYSSPQVYLRELIQNAVDAIAARSASEPGWRTRGVKIVPADASAGTPLTVADDGIGLTADDIEAFLASVGSSTKRDEFGMAAPGMIGRFGIGLLSAFMVCDSIELETRSAHGSETLRWVGHSGGTYELTRSASARPVGTTVTLRPRADDAALVGREGVLRLARHYGRYLGVPITVDGLTINEPPAFLSQEPEALLTFGEELLGERPFAIIPFEVPLTGTRATAFVLPYPVPPTAGGVHQVYCHRMLVTDQHRDIAPEWAFFARIVLDSTGLTPTASRESLVADGALATTREAIGNVLRGWLAALAEQEPAALDAFVGIHYLGLKALAIHADDIAPLIVRFLPLETSHGLRQIGELVADSPELAFVRSTDQFRQVLALSSGTQPIVNAAYTWDTAVLRRLPELIPGVSVREIGVQDVLDRLTPVPSPDASLAASLESRAHGVLASADAGVTVRVASSPDVPAFLLTDPDLIKRQERDKAREQRNRWSKVLASLDAATADRDAGPAARVVLNWGNPLVRRLADQEDPALFERSIRLLHLQAILGSGRPLSSAESATLTATLSDLMLLGMKET